MSPLWPDLLELSHLNYVFESPHLERAPAKSKRGSWRFPLSQHGHGGAAAADVWRPVRGCGGAGDSVFRAMGACRCSDLCGCLFMAVCISVAVFVRTCLSFPSPA